MCMHKYLIYITLKFNDENDDDDNIEIDHAKRNNQPQTFSGRASLKVKQKQKNKEWEKCISNPLQIKDLLFSNKIQ